MQENDEFKPKKLTPEEQHKKDKRNNVLKYVLNVSLVLVITAVALVINLYNKLDTVMNQLKQCDYRWILLIVGLLLATIAIRSLVLYCFARLYTRKYKFHQAVAVDEIGQFYNAVTLGASGGQLMQATTYKKQGLNIACAVSILAMYSIVYQTVLCLYGFISFICKFDFINSIGEIPFSISGWSFSIPIWPLTILGFVVNLSIILIVFLMAYWKGFHRFIMGPCITVLSKIHLLKDPERKREDLRIIVENFKIEFKRLLTNIPFMILIALLFFAYLTLRFSIPYFVGLSLGNQSSNATFWDAVLLSNYHQMVTGLIPIPGSAGVSEYFFSKLFANFYMIPGVDSNDLCSTALLIWRSLTFTIPLIIAGFVTAFYRPRNQKEIEAFPEKGRETFLDLSRATITLRLKEVEANQKLSMLGEKDENDPMNTVGNKGDDSL